ncbi:MAG: hypothetical protein HOP27_05775 [Anaerolineales bacterium]|nr:hypothetical protein [Anaerolineales bacterium]
MRVFEWLFLLVFTPILLIPFIPHTWRRRWLIVSALLPILMGGIHLIAEGWRIQMAPLYMLAVLALAGRLPELLGREGVRRGRGILVSGVTALFLIFSGLLAGWLLPVVTLPDPTGPYQVGIVDRELVDEARGRRLMVSIWYPAAQGGKPAPFTHYPDEVATGLGKLSGLPGLPFQHLRYFKLAASEGAPPLEDGAPFPILVFSHGMVGLRLQNSSTLQDLASWGYVVVAIDHTDAAAVTVFPDGETRYYDLERFGIDPADGAPDKALVDERVFPAWVADQRFVYDMLETWAVDDPLFAGKLDLTRIGSFGHSFGGATALEVCLVDTRCRAAVDMDGGLYGTIMTQPAVRPLLLMSSAESGKLPDAVEKWKSMVANANVPAYWLELPNSTHFSFTITQLLSPLLVPKDFDPRDGLHIVDKYLRIFFDMYLRDVETPSLEPASAETDVRWFTKSRLYSPDK